MSVSARSLTRATAFFSACFAVALGLAAVTWHSDLALSQSADSVLDFAGALVLAWVVSVAQTPGDERHPMGHARAEPLGALGVAVLAGMLAFEVGSHAVHSLLGGVMMRPDYFLLALFAGKIFFKGIIWKLASTQKGAACAALLVDARNDILVGLLAGLGFLGARLGSPTVDAWLALPAAVWIGWSGFELARENIDLLLGVAPPIERQNELVQIAESVPGIVDAHELVAHSTGTALSIHIHVTVDAGLTVLEGHDLGEAARARLLEEEDVVHCSVHVDPSGQASAHD